MHNKSQFTLRLRTRVHSKAERYLRRSHVTRSAPLAPSDSMRRSRSKSLDAPLSLQVTRCAPLAPSDSVRPSRSKSLDAPLSLSGDICVSLRLRYLRLRYLRFSAAQIRDAPLSLSGRISFRCAPKP